MSTRNETTGSQSPIINGNNNIVIFNLSEPLTDERLLIELIKLQYGDFENITDSMRIDESDGIKYFSYIKNRYFTMKRKTINNSFYQSWLNFFSRDDPSTFEDEISFFYQSCFIKSFLIVVLDGGRFQLPLPKIIYVHDYDKSNGYDKAVGLSDPVVIERSYPLDNHPVKKFVLTEAELALSKAFSCRESDEYLQQLRQHNKLEIIKAGGNHE
jgi:hypothetical protein